MLKHTSVNPETDQLELPVPGTPPPRDEMLAAWWELISVVAKLRSPEGCPWDRAQTLESIKPHTLEETYELLDAIDHHDDRQIIEELGDVLLQVVLDCQIAADEGRFHLGDVVQHLTRKLIARHPHVFGITSAQTAADVLKLWDHIKQQEKQRESVFDGLPSELPALARAARVQEKAARRGYDFPHRDMLFAKLREELQEFFEEAYGSSTWPTVEISLDEPRSEDPPPLEPERQQRLAEELGDILFVLANIARRWHINPEMALRKTQEKFERRVRFIEQQLQARGLNWSDVSLKEMESYYEQAKHHFRVSHPAP